MHPSTMPTRSSPIQIPQKRRPMVPTSFSPLTQALSPEMIFEMSPTTSDFARHTPFSLANSPTPRRDFLYNIPKFSSPKLPGSGASGSSEKVNASLDASPPTNISIVKHPTPRRSHSFLAECDLLLEAPNAKHTTKITGFLPMKGDILDVQPQDQNVPLERLSPGPRRSSYSSPWILPGKGERTEEDLAYSQVDPSAFDYERQLLQRIENQNRPRLGGLRSYM